MVIKLLKSMGIMRPWLVACLIALSCVFGGGVVYVYHKGVENALVAKYETQKEETHKLEMQLTKTVAEYEKKLKQVTKQTESRPDGTVIVTDSTTQSEEIGKTTSEILYNGQSYRLFESESGYKPWSISFHWRPNLELTGIQTEMIGFSASRELLWRLGAGFIVDYNLKQNQWFLGLSLSYSF